MPETRQILLPHLVLGSFFALFGFIPLLQGSVSPEAIIRAAFGVIGLAVMVTGFGFPRVGGKVVGYALLLLVIAVNWVAFTTPDSASCGFSKYTGNPVSFASCRLGFIIVAVVLNSLVVGVFFIRRWWRKNG